MVAYREVMILTLFLVLISNVFCLFDIFMDEKLKTDFCEKLIKEREVNFRTGLPLLSTLIQTASYWSTIIGCFIRIFDNCSSRRMGKDASTLSRRDREYVKVLELEIERWLYSPPVVQEENTEENKGEEKSLVDANSCSVRNDSVNLSIEYVISPNRYEKTVFQKDEIPETSTFYETVRDNILAFKNRKGSKIEDAPEDTMINGEEDSEERMDETCKGSSNIDSDDYRSEDYDDDETIIDLTLNIDEDGSRLTSSDSFSDGFPVKSLRLAESQQERRVSHSEYIEICRNFRVNNVLTVFGRLYHVIIGDKSYLLTGKEFTSYLDFTLDGDPNVKLMFSEDDPRIIRMPH